MAVWSRKVEPAYDGDSEGAVMQDSVSGLVFGPVWESLDEIDEFLAWFLAQYGPCTDVRMLPGGELSKLRQTWRNRPVQISDVST